MEWNVQVVKADYLGVFAFFICNVFLEDNVLFVKEIFFGVKLLFNFHPKLLRKLNIVTNINILSLGNLDVFNSSFSFSPKIIPVQHKINIFNDIRRLSLICLESIQVYFLIPRHRCFYICPILVMYSWKVGIFWTF